MSVTIAADPDYTPTGHTPGWSPGFLTVQLGPDVWLQVPATAEGREWLHALADSARMLTVAGRSGAAS